MPEAPPRYRFTGSAPKGFFSYADLDGTGMLIAEPGQDYAMRALEPNLPVPPSASEWEPVAVAPAKAKAASSTEGGE